MADFCRACSIELFGEDLKDLAEIAGDGETAMVICEGCGLQEVDKNGEVVNKLHEGLEE